MPTTAKLFMTGKSQAVRLPKEFRFDGQKVRIRREGNTVVLEPLANDWQWLDEIKSSLDSDFVEGALDRPRELQDRPDLDFFS